MLITISGTPGSGKSTVAKILVDKLRAERIYVGGIRRKLARNKGFSLSELNEYALTHPETDVDIDQQVAQQARQLHQQGKVVIVEGRTQYHFLPESVKVYLKVSLQEGAQRIWKELQQAAASRTRNEGKISSLAKMKTELRQRMDNDRQRYQQYYALDPTDEQQYDLVVDTTAISPEKVARHLLQFIRQTEQKKAKNKKTYKL